jgi:hypothetical protein
MRSIFNLRKRLITAEDHTMFVDNPTTLTDKQFLLHEVECDSLYEVTVRSWEYLVRFEDRELHRVGPGTDKYAEGMLLCRWRIACGWENCYLVNNIPVQSSTSQ